jgi:hypothetical protein
MSPAGEDLNDIEGAANAHTNMREVFARSWAVQSSRPHPPAPGVKKADPEG